MRTTDWDDDDDEFWEDEDPGFVATDGHHQPADGTSEMHELLTEITLALTKARMVLSGVEADEWRELQPVLVELQDAFERMPKGPKARRKLGFQVEHKKARTKRK